MRALTCKRICCCAAAFAIGRPACADPKADALIREIDKAHQAVQTLTADLAITSVVGSNKTYRRFAGSAILSKPDRWRFRVKGEVGALWGEPREYTLVSDGTTSWRVSATARRYVRNSTRVKGHVVVPSDPLSRLFFTDRWLVQGDGHAETSVLPGTTIAGVKCKGVRIYTGGIDTAGEVQLYVGPDLLVRRLRERTFSHGWDSVEMTLSKLKANVPVSGTTFRFQPPPDLQVSDQPLRSQYWWTALMVEDLFSTAGADARRDKRLLVQDWPRLAGTWAGPTSGLSDGRQTRYLLRLTRSGADYVLEHLQESTTPDGKRSVRIEHSLTQVIDQVRERDRRRYLALRMSAPRPDLIPVYIRYRFVKGNLELTDSFGVSTWSRLPPGYSLE